MESSNISIPIGYRFNPSDEELVTYYLTPMVKQRNPSRFRPSWIPKKELYGKNANPWDVFSDSDPWVKEQVTDKSKIVKETIYVFTKLTKINGSTKRVSRTAGCGVWDGQTRGTEVYDSQGEVIGSKKMLTFQVKEEANRDEVTKTHGHWIMHEYSLASKGNNNIGDEVICKITRSWKGKYYLQESIKKRRSSLLLEEDIYPTLNKNAKKMTTLDDDIAPQLMSGNNNILAEIETELNSDVNADDIAELPFSGDVDRYAFGLEQLLTVGHQIPPPPSQDQTYDDILGGRETAIDSGVLNNVAHHHMLSCEEREFALGLEQFITVPDDYIESPLEDQTAMQEAAVVDSDANNFDDNLDLNDLLTGDDLQEYFLREQCPDFLSCSPVMIGGSMMHA